MELTEADFTEPAGGQTGGTCPCACTVASWDAGGSKDMAA